MDTIDLAFPITCSAPVPVDHGYPLYAAVSRAIPSAHGADWLAIHPLAGADVQGEQLRLLPHASLAFRLPAAHIPELLALMGTTLTVAGAQLTPGVPRVLPLAPAACLDARTVAIKVTEPPRRESPTEHRTTLDNDALAQRYSAELRRQLHAIGIDAAPQLLGRRTITVAGNRIVTFSVRVDGLSPDQSLCLQERGLGGKHRMGCGIFRASRGR